MSQPVSTYSGARESIDPLLHQGHPHLTSAQTRLEPKNIRPCLIPGYPSVWPCSFSENDPLHQEDNKDDCAANLYVVQCNT